MKFRINIAIGTMSLLTMLYLMIAFYSVSFNISEWTDGGRFSFSLFGSFIGFSGIIGILANANKD